MKYTKETNEEYGRKETGEDVRLSTINGGASDCDFIRRKLREVRNRRIRFDA
jgi:hypothetical protein